MAGKGEDKVKEPLAEEDEEKKKLAEQERIWRERRDRDMKAGKPLTEEEQAILSNATGLNKEVGDLLGRQMGLLMANALFEHIGQNK